MIKVLNAYPGVGGNRKLWENVEVTAVEIDPVVAEIYQDLYPRDTVIIGDAHEYILKHFYLFDFIWSSPPCTSHSRARKALGVGSGKSDPLYVDMVLWQEILFLQHHFEGHWVVENVIPYYKPLIVPTATIQRHYFWANYHIPRFSYPIELINCSTIPILEKYHGIDLSEYKIPGKNMKRQKLRNCVYPPLGLHVFNSAPIFGTTEKPQGWQDNYLHLVKQER